MCIWINYLNHIDIHITHSFIYKNIRSIQWGKAQRNHMVCTFILQRWLLCVLHMLEWLDHLGNDNSQLKRNSVSLSIKYSNTWFNTNCTVVHNDCVLFDLFTSVYKHSFTIQYEWSVLTSNSIQLTYMYNCYLVDPASSHMLVSKIKPCMSKYKHLYTVKLRTAHYISNSFFDGFLLHG